MWTDFVVKKRADEIDTEYIEIITEINKMAD